MSNTVARHIIQRLQGWGVRHLFGYPGDGVNEIVAELGRSTQGPSFVQSRHEEMSALQAVGYAKFGGELGVCLATGGPGAVHLLNGLYDAKLDHVPVLALVGQVPRTALGGNSMQEVDLQSLFKDVAGAYVQTATVPEQFPNVLDRAIRTALTDRCPTAVIVPADLQEEAMSPPKHEFAHVPSSPPGLAAPVVTPPDEELDRAAQVLNAGERVAILVGQGARGAAEEVAQTAEVTRAGVAKALLGKDVLSDEEPYVTGAIGLLGTRPSWEMMRDCDTLLIVGSGFPYTQFLPEFGRRAVEIDIDARMIGMRYPTEVNLVGDAAPTLRALLERLEPQPLNEAREQWRSRIEEGVEHWWQVLGQQAQVPADNAVNPMLLAHELSPRLPENAIVTADSGSAANWYARFLRFRGDMRGSLSGTLATMGCGVPYAIGAKAAHPDRPAIALVGDGAMQMNGLAELITIRRYYEEWTDPRLVVCVLHNNDLNQVTWEQRAMAGSPKTPFSQDLPEVSYASFASSIGLRGISTDTPDEVGSAWDRALAADRPVVLDVRCDPDFPPIPPSVGLDQVADTARALAAGDPDALDVLRKGVRTKFEELRTPRAGGGA
jgi:pyruvate dehydrogenase (quinone)